MTVERYLKEDGTGYFLLEDGSGVLLLESSSGVSSTGDQITHIGPLVHHLIKPRRKHRPGMGRR